MGLPQGLKLGALGGPNTFGGQAAKRIRELYPEFTDSVYFPTSEEGLEGNGTLADATCAPQQMSRTGFHPGIQERVARPGARMYVVAEASHEYHCSLLARPGTRLEDIRKVLGHTGSITQSRPWLEKHVPGAEIVIVDTNSIGAAKEVAEGDGSLASVGTPDAAAQFGLEELAREIDGGSVGHYWALSTRPLFSDRPTRVVVAGRFDEGGRLGDVICAIAGTGFRLQTVYSQPSGQKLFEYDYVLQFAGSGTLAQVQEALKPFTSARLAGAYEVRE